MTKDAIISECGLYRYRLIRTWDVSKPSVMFLMLNPSKADANIDDPTITRCINFAKSWGYGRIMVGNLYAFRATKPKDLKAAGFPAGPNNVFHLQGMADKVEKIICAWGGNVKHSVNLKSLLPNHLDKLYYLEFTAAGQPSHPLMLKGDLKPLKLYEL